VLRGVVRFPPGSAREVAVLRVVLRPVDLADAPAPNLAVLELSDLLVPSDGRVPFELRLPPEIPLSFPADRYAVRAHADVFGTGRVDVGDLVTTSTCFVTPELAGPLALDLRSVGENPS